MLKIALPSSEELAAFMKQDWPICNPVVCMVAKCEELIKRITMTLNSLNGQQSSFRSISYELQFVQLAEQTFLQQVSIGRQEVLLLLTGLCWPLRANQLGFVIDIHIPCRASSAEDCARNCV